VVQFKTYYNHAIVKFQF